MNNNVLQKAYSDWGTSIVGSRMASLGLTNMSPVGWLERGGYFLTIMFDQRRISRMKASRGLLADDTSIEFDCFNSIYMSVSRKLIGKRFTHAKYYRSCPVAIAGIDCEGSKYAAQAKLAPLNLHIHAIVAVPPSISDGFDSMIRSPDALYRFQEFGPIDAISFDAYDSGRGHSAFTYALKVQTKSVNSPSSAELMRIYPNPDPADHHIKYKRTNSYPKRTMDLRKLQFALRLHNVAERSRLVECPWEAAY